MGEEYLTTEQAAEFMGFSASSLRKWRFERSGPPYSKAGSTQGAARYLKADLIAYMQARRVVPAGREERHV